MKTVIMKKEVPMLEISFDDCSDSPREGNNLGTFITLEDGRSSPDKGEGMREIIESTQHDAEDCNAHIELIKEGLDSVRMLMPICRHEHGGVKYYISSNSDGFDTAHCGFYVVFNESESYGNTKKMSDEEIERVVRGELETYSQWVNGAVYRFLLRGDDGEVEDICAGFYGVEDIKEHLPDEWKDEDLSEYLV